LIRLVPVSRGRAVFFLCIVTLLTPSVETSYTYHTMYCIFIYGLAMLFCLPFFHRVASSHRLILTQRSLRYLRFFFPLSQNTFFFFHPCKIPFSPSRFNMDSNGSSNQVWCSSCKKPRDAASFETTKHGKERKTCNRHGKKRNIDVVFDHWDDFEDQLAMWNRPVRT
jgi:hypothetical protein